MVLQLLRDHKNEVAIPVSGATERVVMAVLRAVVDLGLASGASRRSTGQRAVRALCGYLFYAGYGGSGQPAHRYLATTTATNPATLFTDPKTFDFVPKHDTFCDTLDLALVELTRTYVAIEVL
jgi:hypothetical protein